MKNSIMENIGEAFSEVFSPNGKVKMGNKTISMAEVTRQGKARTVVEAIDTFRKSQDLWNMDKRELAHVESCVKQIALEINDLLDIVYQAIDDYTPPTQCERCDSNDVIWDTDCQELWCQECDDWSLGNRSEFKDNESQESIDRHNSGAIEASDRNFMKAGW